METLIKKFRLSSSTLRLRTSFIKNQKEKPKRRPRRPKRSKQTLEEIFAPTLKKTESDDESNEEDSLMSDKYWKVANKENISSESLSPKPVPKKVNDVENRRKVENNFLVSKIVNHCLNSCPLKTNALNPKSLSDSSQEEFRPIKRRPKPKIVKRFGNARQMTPSKNISTPANKGTYNFQALQMVSQPTAIISFIF